LYDERKFELLWHNFVHPGDAFAYPSAPLLGALLQKDADTVKAFDWLVKIGLAESLFRLLSRSMLSIFDAPAAHNSYWDNRNVIRSVVQAVREAAKH
jgi:hypothetical protein